MHRDGRGILLKHRCWSRAPSMPRALRTSSILMIGTLHQAWGSVEVVTRLCTGLGVYMPVTRCTTNTAT